MIQRDLGDGTYASYDEGDDGTWVHGTRYGREHRDLRQHMVEDHGADEAKVWPNGNPRLHMDHDALHGTNAAYAKDVPHDAVPGGPESTLTPTLPDGGL